jgi:hypothetical protein
MKQSIPKSSLPFHSCLVSVACDRLQEMDRLKEMAGTLRVVEVGVEERIIDEIVSEGIRLRQINFNQQGGAYAGVH